MRFDNKIVSRTVCVGFALLLAALFAAVLLRDSKDSSYFENRALAKKPVAESAAVLDGDYFTALERYLADHTAGRTAFIKLNTAVSLALGKPVVNEVVVKDDMLLPFNKIDAAPDPADLAYRADAEAKTLAAHRDAAESYGGRFCYVAVPCQYVCRENDYPWYLENHAELTKASSEALFAALEAEGVEYIDMLEAYRSFDTDRKAKFTSTVDNHYSIFGAYETYLKMTSWINAADPGAVDVLDEDEMRVEKIGGHYLGSRNRKLFDLWQNDEALYCIYPTEDIPFCRYDGGEEVDPTVYALPAPGDVATYGLYMGGDLAQTTVETDRPDLPSVLIYGDSFTNAVECVAWYSFDRMDTFDLRHYKDKTLDELIAELKPDYVFCIRDYESLLDLTNNGK